MTSPSRVVVTLAERHGKRSKCIAGMTVSGGWDYGGHQGNLVSERHDGSLTSMNDFVDKAQAEVSMPNPGMGGPQSEVAREICRGVVRLLASHGLAALSELPLPNGRRADVVAMAPDGAIWIVEIKSCLEDFRSDHKWPEYRDFADRLFFAVLPKFPIDVLPSEAGLIVADRYGGEILRSAPEHRLPAPRRKAMTLRVARTSAARLSLVLDPTLPAAIGAGVFDV